MLFRSCDFVWDAGQLGAGGGVLGVADGVRK